MTSPGTRVSHEAAVLIVEDGPLVRAFAADILMDAGYRVFEACEAADALTILEGRDDIGTVFTDIEMSGMTGLALAGVITEGWPEIAILVTSGRIQPDPGTLPAGAAFIAKPYKADALIGQLAELVAR
ncbi:response regulator [Sphingomonadales bacterium 56]|jgi:CheY-like chemotaxis protein|uniref:Response regulator n=1 Tax=Sphingobium yanoikuyae TaxID=13690 RepID=A0A9X7YGD3_SPHYA|nr:MULTISPECIES: response regulator [Sphingobium]MAB46809.1 response regulator [Sphingomonadaceae bacterium]MBL4791472.1 response regulator [Citromicrobium sp.]MBY2930842.1 response regulator [Sphingomonadales bacterium 56]MBY2960923.1 response regulator [Sphingomonadales bacterium 58]AMK20940.1 response regulator receiver domain-containing protein [Sphingobium sp. MI1205]|tara:strand:+ start:2309 stop:2692 length:384 start_codon:yes stop_codon:yes gene_type:complete